MSASAFTSISLEDAAATMSAYFSAACCFSSSTCRQDKKCSVQSTAFFSNLLTARRKMEIPAKSMGGTFESTMVCKSPSPCFKPNLRPQARTTKNFVRVAISGSLEAAPARTRSGTSSQTRGSRQQRRSKTSGGLPHAKQVGGETASRLHMNARPRFAELRRRCKPVLLHALQKKRHRFGRRRQLLRPGNLRGTGALHLRAEVARGYGFMRQKLPHGVRPESI